MPWPPNNPSPGDHNLWHRVIDTVANADAHPWVKAPIELFTFGMLAAVAYAARYLYGRFGKSAPGAPSKPNPNPWRPWKPWYPTSMRGVLIGAILGAVVIIAQLVNNAIFDRPPPKPMTLGDRITAGCMEEYRNPKAQAGCIYGERSVLLCMAHYHDAQAQADCMTAAAGRQIKRYGPSWAPLRGAGQMSGVGRALTASANPG
jgi:hypothetical protein